MEQFFRKSEYDTLQPGQQTWLDENPSCSRGDRAFFTDCHVVGFQSAVFIIPSNLVQLIIWRWSRTKHPNVQRAHKERNCGNGLPHPPPKHTKAIFPEKTLVKSGEHRCSWQTLGYCWETGSLPAGLPPIPQVQKARVLVTVDQLEHVDDVGTRGKGSPHRMIRLFKQK